MAARPIQVFVSYARRDQALKDGVVAQLRGYESIGLLQAWHDRTIEIGTEWEAEITSQLRSARIVLLLLSPAFLASEHCRREMDLALERAQSGALAVVPVLLERVDLAGLPVTRWSWLPRDSVPLADSARRVEAVAEVVEEIVQIAHRLGTTPGSFVVSPRVRYLAPAFGVMLIAALFARYERPARTSAAPVLGAPIEAQWRPLHLDDQREWGELTGDRAFLAGHAVAIEIRLEEAASAYLLHADPSGRLTCTGNGIVAPRPTTLVRFPVNDAEADYLDVVGTHAYFLLASRSELPPCDEWLRASAPPEDVPRIGVAETLLYFDGHSFWYGFRRDVRPSVPRPQPPAALARLCQAFSDLAVFQSVSAIAFPVGSPRSQP